VRYRPMPSTPRSRQCGASEGETRCCRAVGSVGRTWFSVARSAQAFESRVPRPILLHLDPITWRSSLRRAAGSRARRCRRRSRMSPLENFVQERARPDDGRKSSIPSATIAVWLARAADLGDEAEGRSCGRGRPFRSGVRLCARTSTGGREVDEPPFCGLPRNVCSSRRSMVDDVVRALGQEVCYRAIAAPWRTCARPD